jgi:hypothetical protein
MAGLSFAAWSEEWMPLPMETTQNGQVPSTQIKGLYEPTMRRISLSPLARASAILLSVYVIASFT